MKFRFQIFAVIFLLVAAGCAALVQQYRLLMWLGPRGCAVFFLILATVAFGLAEAKEQRRGR